MGQFTQKYEITKVSSIMEDSKIYAAIRLKELDMSLANDPEILLSNDKKRADAKHRIVSMAMAAGGHEIGEHEGDLIIDLPLDNAEVLRNIHTQLEEDIDMSTTIGVGDEVKDAKIALDSAIKNRPGTIKIFEPHMANDKLNTDEESKFDYFTPESVALDEEGRPVNIKKAEGNPPKHDWANDKEAISPQSKEKIAAIIQMLQNKKEYLNSLQQTNPDIYQGVVAIVTSLSTMAQNAKEEDAKAHRKMVTKVSNQLDAAEDDMLDSESIKVLEALIEAEKEKKAKEDEHFHAIHSSVREKHLKKEKESRHHNSNVKFLMKLADKARG